MAQDIEAQILIPRTAPAVVFGLLTIAYHLRAWFAEHAEVDLAARRYLFWGAYTPETPAQNEARSSLLRSKPPADSGAETRVAAYAWRLNGSDTEVDYKLGAQDGGTLLTVLHSGLNPRGETQGALHDFWISKLESLRLYALTRKPQTQLRYGPPPGPNVKLELDILGSAVNVYRYLIEPECVGQLWDDKRVEIDPWVGGTYSYGWELGGAKIILELDSPNLLSFSWRYPPETEDSTVIWRLSEAAGVTRLSLEHSGLAGQHVNEGYQAGWFTFLVLIKSLIELGPSWTRVAVKGVEHGAV
jgi:uncharacterized protein YndB with AHSA1/START domain